MLIVDADHFKQVNDRYDHSIDDEVLKSLGRCLEVSMHRPDDLVARGGGEEFGMLLPDTDVDGALRIAKKIHEQVSTLDVHSSGIFACTITIGVGIASGTIKDEVNRGNMYRKADVVIYEAKKAGRNCTRPTPASNQVLEVIRQVNN